MEDNQNILKYQIKQIECGDFHSLFLVDCLIKKDENDFRVVQRVIELGNIFGNQENFCYTNLTRFTSKNNDQI